MYDKINNSMTPLKCLTHQTLLYGASGLACIKTRNISTHYNHQRSQSSMITYVHSKNKNNKYSFASHFNLTCDVLTYSKKISRIQKHPFIQFPISPWGTINITTTYSHSFMFPTKLNRPRKLRKEKVK